MKPTHQKAQSAINRRGPVGGTSPLRKTEQKKRNRKDGSKRDQENRSRQEQKINTRLKCPNITNANNTIRQRVPTSTRIRNKTTRKLSRPTANHRERSAIHGFRAARQSGRSVELRQNGPQRMSVAGKYFKKVRQRTNQSSVSQIDAQR